MMGPKEGLLSTDGWEGLCRKQVTFGVYMLNKKKIKGRYCMEMMNVGSMLSIVLNYIAKEKGSINWEMTLEK